MFSSVWQNAASAFWFASSGAACAPRIPVRELVQGIQTPGHLFLRRLASQRDPKGEIDSPARVRSGFSCDTRCAKKSD